MRVLQVIAWFLLVVAVGFTLFRIKGADLALIFSVFLITIHAIISQFIQPKSNIVKNLFTLAMASIAVFFLFRFLLWKMTFLLIGISAALVLVYIVIAAVKSEFLRSRTLTLLLFFIFNVFLFFMPTYQMFAISRMNQTFAKKEVETNYRLWYKYAWLLNASGKFSDSKAALLKSKEIASVNLYSEPMTVNEANLKTINEMTEYVSINQWNQFVPLDAGFY